MNDSVSGCYEGRDWSREIYLKCIFNLFPFPFEETKQISFVFCLSYTFELIFLVEGKIKANKFGTQFFFLSISHSLAARTRKIWFSHLEWISKRTHKVKFWKVNKQKTKNMYQYILVCIVCISVYVSIHIIIPIKEFFSVKSKMLP